jgi:SAM-dependent methyltransferase
MGSFEKAGKWYDSIVGEKGHYYHQHVILPHILPWIKDKSVLDLACGQGFLERHVSASKTYLGLEISPFLVKSAKNQIKYPQKHSFHEADITKPLDFVKDRFDVATLILAAQNIQNIEDVFSHVYPKLVKGGEFILVLNHPCFRIPRQSSWGIDDKKVLQYRRIDSYLSSLEIPIAIHPSQSTSEKIFSYHYPLSAYVNWLSLAGFRIHRMEEWISDKISTGKSAKMENRSRKEFPLFLSIAATA